MNDALYERLRQKARDIRIEVIKSLALAGSGHLGGSLGLADIFSVLYFNELQHNPSQPHWENRDRLILSIGHVAPALYATLALSGYFPVEELTTLRQLGSRLQGHPALDSQLPGLETSSGSLGQGLSIGVGMALAAKIDQKKHRIFVIMGDGELQEGMVWEAAMSAAHHTLNNLVAIVDRNRVQIDGSTSEVMELEPLQEKWKAFGWKVLECNGNHVESICNTFHLTRKSDKPVIILAYTQMGKGVAEIEGDYRWHGKAPTPEQAQTFIQEILQSC